MADSSVEVNFLQHDYGVQMNNGVRGWVGRCWTCGWSSQPCRTMEIAQLAVLSHVKEVKLTAPQRQPDGDS
jgi:hypothetical protein